jgi:hypothetical protein
MHAKFWPEGQKERQYLEELCGHYVGHCPLSEVYVIYVILGVDCIPVSGDCQDTDTFYYC